MARFIYNCEFHNFDTNFTRGELAQKPDLGDIMTSLFENGDNVVTVVDFSIVRYLDCLTNKDIIVLKFNENTKEKLNYVLDRLQANKAVWVLKLYIITEKAMQFHLSYLL